MTELETAVEAARQAKSAYIAAQAAVVEAKAALNEKQEAASSARDAWHAANYAVIKAAGSDLDEMKLLAGDPDGY